MISFTGLTKADLDEPHLDRMNEIVRQVVNEVNRLGGAYGPIALLDSIDMGGNRIMNVAAPPTEPPPTSNPPGPTTGPPTPPTGKPPTGGVGTPPNTGGRPPVGGGIHDVLTQSVAVSMFGPDAIASQLEATGSKILQTARRLNDGTQQEKSSTFLKTQASMVPSTNTSTITVVAAGGNSTITVTAGTITFADKSTKNYSQRIDTVPNPGAGSNFYYFFFRFADATLQIVGPFTTNISMNQLAASQDGRQYIGTAQVNAAGGGTGGGGGGGTPGGCVEIGTPVTYYQGTESFEQTAEACEDWADITLNDGRSLSMHPDTLVSVFVRAKDLEAVAQRLDTGALVEVDTGGMSKLKSMVLSKRKSVKIKRQVKPLGVYAANGIRLHNFKTIQL